MITIDNYIPVLQTIKNRADAYSNEYASPHEKEFAEKCFQRERQSLSALPLSDDELRESAKLCKTWLDEFDEYNKSIGSSLQNLAEQPQDVVGREKELGLLEQVLTRPITPIALLIGNAGVGKTAIVEEFVKRTNEGRLGIRGVKYLVVSLALGALSALDRNKLQAAISNVLADLKNFEIKAQKALMDDEVKMLLFIDEVHMLVTIFGEGTKIGGDLAKDKLARAPIRVIAATTSREYDSTIAVDEPFAERFKRIEIQELDRTVVHDIARNWWSKVAVGCPVIGDDVIEYIIDNNKTYRPSEAEPRKTLDTLEDMVSTAILNHRSPTKEDVDRIFRDRFSIELKFNINADKVFDNIRSQVLGQPIALYTWNLLLHATAFRKRQNSNRPIFTCLLTGSTGTGKSQSVKALAETLYPGQHVLETINVPEYANDADSHLFRERLGEIVRHKPNAVIQLDEFEKGSKTFRQDCLYILDEGMVNYTVLNREGRVENMEVSLRNTIVIATTNAGANVFKDDAKHSNSENDVQFDKDGQIVITHTQQAETDRLLSSLRESLIAADFAPELLGRFDQIIPYRALSAKTSLDLIELKLMKMLKEIKEDNGIDVIPNDVVQWSKSQYDCRARDIVVYLAYVCLNISDSNAGGARRIEAELQSNVFYKIVQAACKYPDVKKFKLSVEGVNKDLMREDGTDVYTLDNEIKNEVKVVPYES